jgi:CheY-like chemotaxis protein
MPFAYHHRPSTIAFLDDDVQYLEMLSLVIPATWSVKFFSRPQDFVTYFSEQALSWEQDLSTHTEMIDQSYIGRSLPRLILDYWRSDQIRYRLATIAVVDYAMPSMNGLDVLRELPAAIEHRVLLTGKAEDHTAIDAFNDSLIDRYIKKQAPDLIHQLMTALKTRRSAPMPRMELIWTSILTNAQRTALSDRAVQRELSQWLTSQRCVEYFFLRDPFGMLALSDTGAVHWLQLELHANFKAARDMASAAGHDAHELEEIGNGNLLSDCEWLHALKLERQPQVAPARSFGVGGHLVGAHFPQADLPADALTYSAFMESQPSSKRTADI